MSLGEVIESVIEVTGRPDKETYIRSSIDAIVRTVASLKDNEITLVEAPYTVSSTLTIHTLALPADFRKVAYLRPASVKRFLTAIHPNRALSQGQELVNIYYRSGNNLIVKLQFGYETTEIAFGYYANPSSLTLDSDTNWVLADYQDLIIDLLTAKVLRVTGDIKSASAIEGGTIIRIQQIMEAASTSDVVLGG